MEQEYKYNKSQDFAETVSYYAWWRLRLLIERISGCPMCSPGRGCNRRNKRRERCWKSQRKNQYKPVKMDGYSLYVESTECGMDQ